MLINSFLDKLHKSPELIEFTDTMAVIEANYLFSETGFSNGEIKNEVGQNSGSCKLFSFATLHNLTAQETLACFGAYYRDDVLKNPDNNDHQNIRQFITLGWSGIRFEATALTAK